MISTQNFQAKCSTFECGVRLPLDIRFSDDGALCETSAGSSELQLDRCAGPQNANLNPNSLRDVCSLHPLLQVSVQAALRENPESWNNKDRLRKGLKREKQSLCENLCDLRDKRTFDKSMSQ